MMFRLVLYTLLFTLRIVSYVSARSLPSQQLDKVSRILLRYSSNETTENQYIVAWNAELLDGSFFSTKFGITSAVFYSLSEKQKYVMNNWPNGTCRTEKVTSKGSHPTEDVLSSGKKFGVIQLLSGDLSLSVKSCTYRSSLGPCLSDYVCEFLNPDKVSGSVVINNCTGKVWQAILPRKRRSDGKIEMIKFTIEENIANWTDEDWHTASAYGDSKSIIDVYLVTPSGVYCKGRTMRSMKLPSLPKYFSMRVEEVHAHEPDMRKTSFKVFDYKNRLVREDFAPDPKHHARLHHLFGGGMLRTVEDFNTGARFVMDTRRGNCTIVSLETGLFSIPAQHGHMRMKYSYEVLDLQEGRCWQYSGRVHVRGHPADRFICRKKLGSYPERRDASVETIEIYVSAPKASERHSGLMLMRHIQVPVDKTLTKEFLDYTWHVIDFRVDQSDPTMEIFDVDPCFIHPWTDRSDYYVIVQAKYEELIREVGLYSSIRSALAKASNLPPQRISRLRLGSSDPDYVIVWFTLLGLPPPTGRNVLYVLHDRVALTDARRLLQTMVDRNLVSVRGAERKYRVMPNSLHAVRRAALASPAGPAAGGGYTGGNMAAVALSMLGVGSLGTAMAIFCVQRRRRATATAYYVKT